MVRKVLHAAGKAGKEVFAMTSHVRPLFHLTHSHASVSSAGTTVADVVDNFQKAG